MDIKEKQKVEKFIQGMFDADSTFDEIKTSLFKKNLTESEINEMMSPFYKEFLKKKIKKQIILLIVLICSIFMLVGSYLYGQYQNQIIIKNSKSSIVFISKYDFFMKMAIWCLIGFIVILIRFFILKKELNKLKIS